MSDTVSLPLWLAVLLVAAAVWLALERLLVPSVRWVLRRRVNRVLEEANKRLAIHVQPFKLTRRRTLIDRLMYDSEVQKAAAEFGEENDMPRELVMQKVGVYAREIVPAFVPRLKQARPEVHVILAGYPKEQVDEYQRHGIDGFIHLRADCLSFLRDLHRQLGITRS